MIATFQPIDSVRLLGCIGTSASLNNKGSQVQKRRRILLREITAVRKGGLVIVTSHTLFQACAQPSMAGLLTLLSPGKPRAEVPIMVRWANRCFFGAVSCQMKTWFPFAVLLVNACVVCGTWQGNKACVLVVFEGVWQGRIGCEWLGGRWLPKLLANVALNTQVELTRGGTSIRSAPTLGLFFGAVLQTLF